MAGAMATKYAELAEQFEWHIAMARAMEQCTAHHLLEAAGYKERMEDYTRELRSKGGASAEGNTEVSTPSQGCCCPKRDCVTESAWPVEPDAR